MARTVVGVDGCPLGWVSCVLGDDGSVSLRVLPTIAAVYRSHPGADLILVDIPIGLPDRGARACDLRAKKILGKYNSRVFLTPPRAVFDEASYEDANPRCRSLSDRGLMKQMWSIMPKIAVVDEVLRQAGPLRRVVRECHPEICLWGLTGSVVASNKKTDEGEAERLEVLRRFIPGAADLLVGFVEGRAKKELVRDDVVDAMICAVAAAGVWDGTLRTLPDGAERDGCGLAMEMVYRAVDSSL